MPPSQKKKIEKLIKSGSYDDVVTEVQIFLSKKPNAANPFINDFLKGVKQNIDNYKNQQNYVGYLKEQISKDLDNLSKFIFGGKLDDDDLPVILFTASNPINFSKIQFETEFFKIHNVVSQSENKYDTVSQTMVDALSFQSSINKYKPQIIHFSGHGVGKEAVDNARAIGRTEKIPEGIVFKNQDGTPKIIKSEGLQALFSNFLNSGLDIDLVILNCCYSWKQAEAIKKAGVPFVVGMKDAVYDTTAIDFAESFYAAYSIDKNVKKAFNQAKAYLVLQECPDKDVPVLYG